MKKFVICYVVLTALLLCLLFYDSLRACSFPLVGGRCGSSWREVLQSWSGAFIVMCIPLMIIILVALILHIVKLYTLGRSLLASLLLVMIWWSCGAPTSLSEAIFYANLKYSVSDSDEKIELNKLMPGKWEMVCGSDGYDGPVFIEKHNKWYQPVGYAQDGWWGLLFVFPDGSYKPATNHIPSIYMEGCAERDKAILYKGEKGYTLPKESKATGVKFI